MRTTRIVRTFIVLFIAGLVVAFCFALAARVQWATAAEFRHSTAFYRYQWLEGRERQDELRGTNKSLRRDLNRAKRRLEVRFRRDVTYAIRLASDLFSVPEQEMWSVAHCETGGTFSPFAKNRSSDASGLFQFIGWPRAGLRESFSVWDPVANALAAAWTRRHDGSWRQWAPVCRP